MNSYEAVWFNIKLVFGFCVVILWKFATVINIKRVSIPRLFHMAFHGICDLKAIRKYNWKIKVRVTKKWCERNAVSGKRNGLNLILVDEEHERIHACMGESVLKYFDKIFHEGHAYVIRNFRVKYYESSEINRCFKNEQHIVLSCLTRAYRVKENICNIPSNVWKFADLGKLNEFDENINHFIDVIGLIHSVDPAQSISTDGKDEAFTISFFIVDNINKVKVTFSGDFAKLLDVALIHARELPAVIAISSCQCYKETHSEERSLLSTCSTKFTLNPDLGIVSTLRTRFWDIHGG